jgi:hypothetical protein
LISLVNIIFEVGHGGNFLTHTLATEYLNCVDRKLKPELVSHNKDNNEYLKTCFHPIIDRSHAHHLDPNEFEKLRDSKCVVITSSPDVYNKIFNMGIWKNRFRKNIEQNLGYIDDTTEQFNEYQHNINKAFPNKEYFEMDYQDLFLDINKERIQEMLEYICFPIKTTNNVTTAIKQYTKDNESIFAELQND